MLRKNIIKVLRFSVILALILLMAASFAFAEEGGGDLEADIAVAGSEDTVTLKAVDVDGTPYFFLPSGVGDESVTYRVPEGA